MYSSATTCCWNRPSWLSGSRIPFIKVLMCSLWRARVCDALQAHADRPFCNREDDSVHSVCRVLVVQVLACVRIASQSLLVHHSLCKIATAVLGGTVFDGFPSVSIYDGF